MKTIDHYPAETVANVLAWLESFNFNTFNVYALIDHSFDPKLIKKLKNKVRWTSLYQDYAADTDISPILCHLDFMDISQLRTQVELLLSVTNGQAMLSFWLSALDPEEIYSHFASYTEVVILPEKLCYLLRYADTRILPNLLEVMTAVQKAQFLSAFYAGSYFNRAANLVHLSGAHELQINEPTLCLTEPQFAQMLEASETDQIIQQLRKLNVTAELSLSESQIYQQVKQLCMQAHAAGLSDFAELQGYCIEQFIAGSAT